MINDQIDETCRGALGAVTALDLRKRGDVALLHRALANGWPVKQSVRDAIVEQLPSAIETPNDRLAIRLAKLALLMGVRDRLEDGRPPTKVGLYLRPTPRREGTRRPRSAR